MNDYELTINNIEYYRDKICEEVNHECEECEAGYKDCRCKEQCSFDDVIRLIRVNNGVY